MNATAQNWLSVNGMTAREAAHWYIDHTPFYVFVCVVLGKAPACTNGHRAATRDHAQIDAWFDENENYNVAISPGHSLHTVLDTDPPIGEETLASLELEHGMLPATLTATSPRGGKHRILKGKCSSSVGTEKNGLGPKLDTRAYGGFIVAAPSRVRYDNGHEGKYEWDNNEPIADLPAWVPQTLARKREEHKGADVALDLAPNVERARSLLRSYVAANDIAIEGNGGDDRTYRLACEVLNLGLSPAKAFELIRDEWNDACEPPWDHDELAVKVRNAAEYAQNDAGAWAVAPGAETFAAFAASQPEQPRADDTLGQFRFVLRDPVADAARPPITFRDDARLWPNSPEGTVTQLISGAKQHKTGLVLGEMYRLKAAGVARVLYVPLEGEYGITTQRLPALVEFYGDTLDALPGHFQIASAAGFALDNSESVAGLIEAANAWGKQLGFGGWTDLIIDTQHRAAGGLEENSATDSRILWNAVDRIRRGITHDGGRLCNVTLLHHTGKDASKGGRGSSADEAAVDQLLELKTDKTSNTAVVTVKARKDGPDGITARFRIEFAGPLKVPVLIPVSDSDYRKLTGADDPYGNGKIGAALRALKAFGKAHAVKTPILAVELIKLWGEFEAEFAVQDANERTVANRLNERVKKGSYRAYLVHLVGEPVKPHLWCLPEELANEDHDGAGEVP